MKFLLLIAALFAAVSALTHNVAEVENAEQIEQAEARTPKTCALQLQAALNSPQTPTSTYLHQISKTFKCSGQVLYTTNNVSYIENFQQKYGVQISVYDAFGNIIYPATEPNYGKSMFTFDPVTIAHQFTTTAAADINNPIVVLDSGVGTYSTEFIVYSPFGEVKYVQIALPASTAPFFK